MALYSSREVQSTRFEWSVPDGAPIAELQRAVNAAWEKYKDVNGLAEDATASCDDWCRIGVGSHGGDDGIVISFVEESM